MGFWRGIHSVHLMSPVIQMMFLCEQDMFKVALNGSHLLEYRHRLPFQNISAMQIDGDCVVTQIAYH